jgi:hypothetical protein
MQKNKKQVYFCPQLNLKANFIDFLSLDSPVKSFLAPFVLLTILKLSENMNFSYKMAVITAELLPKKTTGKKSYCCHSNYCSNSNSDFILLSQKMVRNYGKILITAEFRNVTVYCLNYCLQKQ